MNENSVIFKGSAKGILILLDSKTDFTDLKKQLEKKVESAKSFFEGANTSITFKGRTLTEEEELELLDVVSEKSGLDIAFVNKSESSRNLRANMNIPSLRPVLTAKENITNFHKGSIRSGQSINFRGSVVVIGDVNPGGEIKAEGNVIVLGKLKGVVHAGSSGDRDCFVAALYMNPTQLIISDVITYFPADPQRKFEPEYAYIKDNQIFVEPLCRRM